MESVSKPQTAVKGEVIPVPASTERSIALLPSMTLVLPRDALWAVTSIITQPSRLFTWISRKMQLPKASLWEVRVALEVAEGQTAQCCYQ